MQSILEKCTICPRNCGINRIKGEIGYCKAGNKLKVARASLHFWEEPCISGTKGSGTVFFSHCNLGCVFCQNYVISHEGHGKEISVSRLADLFIKLQEKNAHNINLVSPTQYVPLIIEAVLEAKKKGLIIPIVYNTNSYENIETIKLLKGVVDIFLADLKYVTNDYAKKYSKVPDYFKYAKNAIEEMYKEVGSPLFDDQGIMQKGLIVRHLMLPGLLEDSKKVLDYLYNTFKDDIYVSIMHQYTPLHNACEYPEINRKVSEKEYDNLLDYACNLGIENAFIQEEESASEDFVPDFLGEEILRDK